MSKLPKAMMDTELEIQLYIPLLDGESMIESLDFRGFPSELTENLLAFCIGGVTEKPSTEYQGMCCSRHENRFQKHANPV